MLHKLKMKEGSVLWEGTLLNEAENRKIKVRIKQLLEGHRKNTFNWTTDVSQMTVLQLPSRIMREKDVSGTLLRSFCKHSQVMELHAVEEKHQADLVELLFSNRGKYPGWDHK